MKNKESNKQSQDALSAIAGKIEVTFEDEINAEPILLVYTQGVVDYDPGKSGHQFLISEFRTDKSYRFELKNQLEPQYFSVLLTYPLSTIVLIRQYNCEPGDDVIITVKSGPLQGRPNLSFSGQGVAKYICRYEYDRLIQRPSTRMLKHKAAQKVNLTEDNQRFLNHLRHLINRYQAEMSPYAYHLLYADMIGHLGRSMMIALYKKLAALSEGEGPGFDRKVKTLTKVMDYDFMSGVDPQAAHDSREYAWFIINHMRCTNLIAAGRQDDVAVYHQLRNLPAGKFRDRLLLIFVLRFKETLKGGYLPILEDAVQVACDSLYKARIAQLEGR